MKEFRQIFIRIFQILIPIILSIVIPLVARASLKRRMRRINENLLELRKQIPGDVYKAQDGFPYFKGKYGPRSLEISLVRKGNTQIAELQILMGLSTGFPVKIYSKKIGPIKDSIKTGMEYIDNLFTVVSSSTEQAKSLILSISREDIKALSDFLKVGIEIDSEKITLHKRNAGPKDTDTPKMLAILDDASRIARVVERLAPLKTSPY